MMRTMGFCGFDTTKNKKVEGNNAGEVHVILKRKYRQYMNRKGGFNRPLDFVAWWLTGNLDNITLTRELDIFRVFLFSLDLI